MLRPKPEPESVPDSEMPSDPPGPGGPGMGMGRLAFRKGRPMMGFYGRSYQKVVLYLFLFFCFVFRVLRSFSNCQFARFRQGRVVYGVPNKCAWTLRTRR